MVATYFLRAQRNATFFCVVPAFFCRCDLSLHSVFNARLGNHFLLVRLHPDTSLREYVCR